MPKCGYPYSSAPRRAVLVQAAILAAASASFLTACETPFSSNAMDRNAGSMYSESVLARSIADGSLEKIPLNAPTINQGVHEARVDSPGPSTGASAIVPATEGSPADTNRTFIPPTSKSYATNGPSTFSQKEDTIRLSLEDAIARSLRYNLAIKVEAYNPGIREAQITEAMAAFDPVFFINSQWNNQDEPVVLAGQTNGTTWNNQVGIRKLMPWGGTVQASAGDIYRDLQKNTYTSAIIPTPSHEANLAVQIAQPFLRGFGDDINQSNIYLAQRDQRISLETFRRQVITQIANVEEAYHNLVLARSQLDIQQRLLDNTADTYNRIVARGMIDADLIQIKEAQAAKESREADLVVAKSNLRNASDKLKSLINDPEVNLRGNALIVCTDRPIDAPLTFNVAEQMDMALRQRTEMQEARVLIEKTDINITVARNDLLPRADVTVSAQSNGWEGDLSSAFNNTVNPADLIDYSAGLKFEIPIGNQAAQAVVRRRQLERRQAVTAMLQEAQQVILEVKTQLRNLLTSYQEIQARQAARTSAGEELNALTQKESIERLTPEFLRLKLDAQQRLANAELSELQAIINYNLAIMKLEQAKGTLLEYNRIAISPAPIANAREDKGKLRYLDTTYDTKPWIFTK